ncbi:MAG: pyruvate kinase [Nitrospirae bacterium]|nr:pyruvate kinase [Nitrospirota bacterium]
MPKRTKIIATIGPASSSPAVIAKLIHAGMDAARLNFSHGERKDHIARIRLIRQASISAGKPIAIIQDLQGPKLRVGNMQNDGVALKRGALVTLTAKKAMGTSSLISITYPRLAKDLRPGDTVLFDDGRLELRVVRRSVSGLQCKVIRGGTLKSHKGVNLPGANLTLPSLSPKDRQDLLFGIGRGVDYIALSFVRSASDIEATRSFIRKAGADIPIIAKIEKPEAIRNLEEIIQAADGIMVARGDLGVEMSPEQVPLLQKLIIRACNDAEKPVITATQMLESMIENPQPTRAEASDVANAILDGTDCVMLSGETAVGKHPVQAIAVMARIAEQAETSLDPVPPDKHIGGLDESVAHAACRAAAEQHARAIVTFTQSGSTALLVSKHRPAAGIIAPTPFERVARKVSLYWGVIPVILKTKKTTDDMIRSVEAIMLGKDLARKRDLIVITAGVPIGVAGSTNMMKIHRVGELKGLEADRQRNETVRRYRIEKGLP